MSQIGKRVYARKQLYAGKRTRFLTSMLQLLKIYIYFTIITTFSLHLVEVPKLFDACVQVLKDNVQCLYRI